MTVRLIVWKTEGCTLTKRGIWQRNRTIVDAIECRPEQEAELHDHLTSLANRDVYGGAIQIERFEVAP